VASALFLDVKGAFPHTDPRQLAANMQLLGVLTTYVTWMLTKLSGRTTYLAFDDYVSPELEICNGNDQGYPLSVIFYLLYNSLLDMSAENLGENLQLAVRNPENPGNPAVVRDMLACASFLRCASFAGLKPARIAALSGSLDAPGRRDDNHIFEYIFQLKLAVCVQNYCLGRPSGMV
jgi:hypothetical protein